MDTKQKTSKLTTAYTLTDWLAVLDDKKVIWSINIPGTHDSAAFHNYYVSPYTCQFDSITTQLLSGNRFLDIRLKVKRITSGPLEGAFYFVTCHGDWPGNEYGDFASILGECKTFLAKHQNEFIAVSLKIDDWNGYEGFKAEAFYALKLLLRGYPIAQVNTLSTPPQLHEVRGCIYLLNRMEYDDEANFGLWIYGWTRDISWATMPPVGSRSCNFFVQDYANNSDSSNPIIDKFNAFYSAAVASANVTAAGLALNFASGYTLGFGIFGTYIMETLLDRLGFDPGSKRLATFGWTAFDYASTLYQTDEYEQPITITEMIISSNFAYVNFPLAFEVVPPTNRSIG